MQERTILGLFDLLKGIAWPLIALSVAIAYKPQVLSFLPNVFGMLLRSMKLEFLGLFKVEVDAAEQQKSVAAASDATYEDATIQLKELPGLPRSAAMATLEPELNSHLAQIKDDREAILVRNLAQARLEASFGLTYAGIFGSRIAGLVELEARRRVPVSEAHNLYAEAEERHPEIYNDYGFSGWLSFLKMNNLVANEKEGVILTDVGDDFLLWLRIKRLSLNRPF